MTLLSMPQRRLQLVDFVIDTNRINARGKLPAMVELEAWHDRGVIGLVLSDTAYVEIAKGISGSLRQQKGQGYIRTRTIIGTQDEFARVRAIERILFPAGAQDENQRNDVCIVFNADKYGDILITADGVILKNRPHLSKELGIKRIMTDNEAVAHVRLLIRYRDDLVRQVVAQTSETLPSWVGQD